MSAQRPRRARRARRWSAQGFTLVELLVTLAVLGLLLVLLSGALRLGARVWESAVAHSDDTNRMEATLSYLRRAIATTVPPSAASPAPLAAGLVGGADWLEFVAPAPRHMAVGGNVRTTLTLVRTAAARALTAVWLPAHPRSSDAAADWRREVLLADGLTGLEVAYLDAGHDDAIAEWHDSWTESTRLPAAIRLRVTLADRTTWPDLVVALRHSPLEEPR